nr:hypothetical protein [Tanacetum cinerariifolium]
SFQDLKHESGDTRSQGGIKDNDSKIKIQDHWHANDHLNEFPRTRLQVSRKEATVDEVRTQEPIVEDVILKDYVNSEEDVEHDFLVDEENKIVEPDVDVHLFCISIDLLFDNIGITNLVPYDVLEGEDVDAINADGFDSDPGNDDETSNYKRRRLAKLSREMEGVIKASGKRKYPFYTSQNFTTPKEAKDRVNLHSIESRRNLKLYKNDNVMIRSRCNGKVHVFLMSQGTRPTGLNHGMEAGPSRSSGPITRSKKGRIHVPMMTVKHVL